MDAHLVGYGSSSDEEGRAKKDDVEKEKTQSFASERNFRKRPLTPESDKATDNIWQAGKLRDMDRDRRDEEKKSFPPSRPRSRSSSPTLPKHDQLESSPKSRDDKGEYGKKLSRSRTPSPPSDKETRSEFGSQIHRQPPTKSKDEDRGGGRDRRRSPRDRRRSRSRSRSRDRDHGRASRKDRFRDRSDRERRNRNSRDRSRDKSPVRSGDRSPRRADRSPRRFGDRSPRHGGRSPRKGRDRSPRRGDRSPRRGDRSPRRVRDRSPRRSRDGSPRRGERSPRGSPERARSRRDSARLDERRAKYLGGPEKPIPPPKEKETMTSEEVMKRLAARAESLKQVAQASAATHNLPSYLNPSVVNPQLYAKQQERRKLLWSSKKKEETPANNTLWSGTKFSGDQGGEMGAKFRRLMGIKGEAAGQGSDEPSGDGGPSTGDKILTELEKEFERSRAFQLSRGAGGKSGIGLGYAPAGYQ